MYGSERVRLQRRVDVEPLGAFILKLSKLGLEGLDLVCILSEMLLEDLLSLLKAIVQLVHGCLDFTDNYTLAGNILCMFPQASLGGEDTSAEARVISSQGVILIP